MARAWMRCELWKHHRKPHMTPRLAIHNGFSTDMIEQPTYPHNSLRQHRGVLVDRVGLSLILFLRSRHLVNLR